MMTILRKTRGGGIAFNIAAYPPLAMMLAQVATLRSGDFDLVGYEADGNIKAPVAV